MNVSIDAKKWKFVTRQISGLLYDKNGTILCCWEFGIQSCNTLCISIWCQNALPYHSHVAI